MAKKTKKTSKKTSKKAPSSKKTETKKVAKKSINGRKKKTAAKASPWHKSVMNLVSRVGDVPKDIISKALNQESKSEAKNVILKWAKK